MSRWLIAAAIVLMCSIDARAGTVFDDLLSAPADRNPADVSREQQQADKERRRDNLCWDWQLYRLLNSDCPAKSYRQQKGVGQ